jgi:glycosyltransferase involved in cell wall biosynthesis
VAVPSEVSIQALVIIPAYNEATTLPNVLQALSEHRAADGSSLDVVVVDDGSTDATGDVVRSAGFPVLRLPYNLGIGGALRTGFRYAIERDYQQAVQLDADGQHDPGAIDVLLAALDDADLVIGSRFADDVVVYQVGRTRRSAMQMLQLLVRALTGRTFTDTSSGFRAFNRPMLEYFARNYPSEYMESVEALLAASYGGFRIVEVPIVMHQRAGGTPSNHRLKLAYHYVRVMLSLLTKASWRRPAEVSTTRSGTT